METTMTIPSRFVTGIAGVTITEINWVYRAYYPTY